MWVGVSMCSWVCGCVCLCVRVCWCEVREGCVCMRVYGLCVYVHGLVFLTSSPPPHTQAHAHTQKQTDNRTCTPPPHTHTHMPLVE